jgi:hypothetical protein
MESVNMELNFRTMSKQELRSYVLQHRDDRDAFYAYMDKLNLEEGRIKLAPLKSVDDMANYPEFLEQLRSQQNHEFG